MSTTPPTSPTLPPYLGGNYVAPYTSVPQTPETAPLAGLLNGHPHTRKRAYYAYATAALIVSIGPDVVIAGVLTQSSTPTFVATIALASSVLLKIGTAFGFVAASNTGQA